MITVPVALGERAYDVLIGDGVLGSLPDVVSRVVGGAWRAAIVTEGPVLEAVGACETGLPSEIHVIEGGEASKVPATVAELCRRFARDGMSRGDVVVALGGGVVTDIAGFAAATYHRGVTYVNVATSLLAQVDAAIGGKTGVNLPEGKNLMGAFWQPAAVLCDTELLSTLPPREWACGRGEMAKYAFLGDGPPDASILSLPLPEQVERCVRIKAEVVAADEREGDRRAVLNYGHTLGHALEAAAFDGGDLRHGEAVAVGMIFAARLAHRLGRVDEARVDLHRRVVGGFDLPSDLPPGSDPEALLEFMARDKKSHGDLTFVLDGPHGVETVRHVEGDDVLATLAEMGADR